MYALADAGKTKPNKPNQTQFLTQKTHLVCVMSFHLGRRTLQLQGPIKYEKERAGNADWIGTDKFGCRRFGG